MITAKEAREMSENRELHPIFEDLIKAAITDKQTSIRFKLPDHQDQLYYEDILKELGYKVDANRVYDGTNYLISW